MVERKMYEGETLFAKSPFIDALKTELEDAKACQRKFIPEVSDRYIQIQRGLIQSEKNGVTVFHGGPLDLREQGVEDSWLTPIEIRDEGGFSNFHVISIGCDSGNDVQGAALSVNLTPEVNLKLNSQADQSVQELRSDILTPRRGNKRLIVRPSITGSLAYPLITTPLDVPSEVIFKRRLIQLTDHLGINSEAIKGLNLSKINDQVFELDAEFENFYISKPKIIDSSVGDIWVYGVMAMEDPWRYYEIFATDHIQNLLKRPNVLMRTDSGCDIGMLYGDLGCDCHSQLLTALSEVKEYGGLIVHAGTQDGRGYGMNTKLETEAHKRGIKSIYNVGKPAMGTLESAHNLFGKQFYDIRTYDGIALMLSELGFRNLTVITDNRKKILQMASVETLNINVQKTGTLELNLGSTAERHIAEKHNSADYF